MLAHKRYLILFSFVISVGFALALSTATRTLAQETEPTDTPDATTPIVVVDPIPPTVEPTAPFEIPTEEAVEPEPTREPTPDVTPTVEATEIPTEEPEPPVTPQPTPTPDIEQTPGPTPTAPALALPWPLPPPANPILGGGPIESLSLIWGGLSFPISQEYGHTAFSLSQPTLYLYGRSFGLDGRAHPGLDIGMPAGTWLYSPVDGTVITSGGIPAFTHYGNGQPGVGALIIETDAGDQVVLGHMGAIAVGAGQRVATGQFVGVSGGENGDHLHLETRALVAGGGYLAVDPRQSFLIQSIAAYAAMLNDEADAAETAEEIEPESEPDEIEPVEIIVEPPPDIAGPSVTAPGDESEAEPADGLEPVEPGPETAESDEAVSGGATAVLAAFLEQPQPPGRELKQSTAAAALGRRETP